ncbi:MAG: hypothetical protein ACI8RZ_001733 [Myxococcota bacterium]|jgi:hypothetical protein
MKAHESRFAPIGLPFVTPGEKPKMIRRGVSGQTNELYSPAELAEVEQRYLDELDRLGSDFPYRDVFSLACP